MSDFPTPGVFNNVNMTSQALIDELEALNLAGRELPGAVASSELTIAGGSITPTGGVHTVDNEGDASTDYLDRINYANLSDGAILHLYAENSGRVPAIRSSQGGIGQIILRRNEAFDLRDNNGMILRRVGSTFKEVQRIGGQTIDMGTGTGATFSGFKFNTGTSKMELWIGGAKVADMSGAGFVAV